MSTSLPEIVCDACSIIRLHKGEILHILPKLFAIYIPEYVRTECNYEKYGKIDLSDFTCSPVQNVLKIGMQKGEREMLSLAMEKSIKRVLTDDNQAFNKAISMKIKPIRTRDILLIAKKGGYLPSVKPALNLMIQKGEGIDYQEILKYVGEK